MKRAVVTGGAGFIGSHVVDALLGWEPRVSFEEGIAALKVEFGL